VPCDESDPRPECTLRHAIAFDDVLECVGPFLRLLGEVRSPRARLPQDGCLVRGNRTGREDIQFGLGERRLRMSRT
jgi:hypothetical protein